jgi:hypothetical protein
MGLNARRPNMARCEMLILGTQNPHQGHLSIIVGSISFFLCSSTIDKSVGDY